MKKIFTSILVIAAAAIAFSACTKTNTPAQDNDSTMLTFRAVANSTKAAFGERDGLSFPAYWTSNDGAVAMSLNCATKVEGTLSITEGTDNKQATISASIDSDGTGEYIFYAMSPASVVNVMNATYKRWRYTIPTTQTSGLLSPDESAMVLYGRTEAVSEFPSSTDKIDISFKHATAYIDFKVEGLTLEDGDAISNYTITGSEYLAGDSFTYANDYSSSHPEGETFGNSGAAKTVTVTPAKAGADSAWVAILPIASGTSLTFTVNTTNGGTYAKTISTPADLASGGVAILTLDFSNVSSKTYTYTKVTSEPSDWTGKYLIVDETAGVAFNAGLETGTVDAGANSTSVTISNNTITLTSNTFYVEVNPSTVATESNCYSVYAKGGYYVGLATAKGTGMSRATSEKATNTDVTFAYSESGVTLQCNGSTFYYRSGKDRFRYFPSQNDGDRLPALYKLSE